MLTYENSEMIALLSKLCSLMSICLAETEVGFLITLWITQWAITKPETVYYRLIFG